MSRVVIGIIKKELPEPSWLLVSSKKDFGAFTGYYYPPGGHVEEGETDEEALVREIREELDLTVTKMEKIHESAGDVAGQMTAWFLCEAEHTDFVMDTGTLADARFFTREEIIGVHLWPATEKVFQEFILNKRT